MHTRLDRNFPTSSMNSANKHSTRVIALPLAIAIVTACDQGDDPKVSFRDDVFPIVVNKCLSCHEENGRGYKRSGLLLTNYENLLQGSTNGPVITPGSTSKSTLSVYIHPSADPNTQMPYGSKARLTKSEIDMIDLWITQGAKHN